MQVIAIDGSYGEGGGSIFRYSLALSAITLKPVEIFNIRAKRSKPGLRPQHLTAAKILAKMTDARFDGLRVGSKRVLFEPRGLRAGSYSFDVGTAGSTSLIVQALLPVTLLADGRSKIEIRGGTDAKFAPPVDYMKEVFLPNLKLMGVGGVGLELVRRGHYPRGGGVVRLSVEPLGSMNPIELKKRGKVERIGGRAHAVKLPRHVAERIARSAEEELVAAGFENASVNMDWSQDDHLGPGAGITLWADSGPKIGADSLGERGKPSETVGKEASRRLIRELNTEMAFDEHMGDMIIPYLALTKGISTIGVSVYTKHILSNLWLAKEVLGAGYDVRKVDNGAIVQVKGAGL